jgi:hypothetical protein
MIGVFGVSAALALLAAGSLARRLAAVALASAALVLPFVLPIRTPFGRAFVACGLGLFLFRIIDLARERRALAPRSRLWLAVAFFDSRRARRTPARMDFRALGRHLAFGLTALAALYAALGLAARLDGHAVQLCRWLGGVVFIYTIVDSVGALFFVIYRPLGITPPPLHETPILARSVQEFWSRRWNRVVGAWLDTHCFRPLARRRSPTLGLVAAFGVSAALHGYFVWAAIGAAPAVLITGFFLLQAPIVVVERTLGVSRWPATVQRAWTIGLLLLLSPLFIEPMLQVLDPSFAR